MVVCCVCAGAVLWEASEFTRNGREGGRGSESERASERASERERWLARDSDLFCILTSLFLCLFSRWPIESRFFVDASYPLHSPPRGLLLLLLLLLLTLLLCPLRCDSGWGFLVDLPMTILDAIMLNVNDPDV
jgi:hypothetical protein